MLGCVIVTRVPCLLPRVSYRATDGAYGRPRQCTCARPKGASRRSRCGAANGGPAEGFPRPETTRVPGPGAKAAPPRSDGDLGRLKEQENCQGKNFRKSRVHENID